MRIRRPEKWPSTLAAVWLLLVAGMGPFAVTAGEKRTPTLSPHSITPKFTLIHGKMCGNKAALGKAACEAAALTAFPGYKVTCTATNVKLDKDCNVTEADCSCTGTRQ